jgi:hypothetical protein
MVASSGSSIVADIPRCWRVRDVEKVVRRGDQALISLLWKYAPFNDLFIPSRPDLSILQCQPTTPDPFSQQKLGFPKDISDFLTLVRQVPFEAWVQESLGLSPRSVGDLKSCFLRLCFRLTRTGKYKNISTVSKSFLYKVRANFLFVFRN